MTAPCRFMELKLGSKATRALRTAMFAVMVQFTPDAEEEFDTGRIMKVSLPLRCSFCQRHRHVT